MAAIDLGLKPMVEDFEAWLDRWVPHYPKCQYMALVSINDALRDQLRAMEQHRNHAVREWTSISDQLIAKTLELETLKNKIVERAQVPATIKAKSAAEIRRMVEQDNEREFEEANG